MALSKLAQVGKSAAPAPSTAAPVAESNELALIPQASGVTTADALNAALSTNVSAARSPFPVVNLTGGMQGGQFAAASFLPQDVQDLLPSGKKPVASVFLNYRLAVSAWATGYKDTPADKAEAAPKPVWSASIAANDVDGLQLVMAAARNYQFTKSADKSKFDYATSKAGHVRLAVEIMVWLPEANAPTIFTTPANFGAVDSTLRNLLKLVDTQTGSLGVFPCTVRPVTVDRDSKGGFKWKEHSIDVVNAANTTEATQVWAAYNAWKAEAVKDPSLVTSVRDWISAQDRKRTGDIDAALKAAASL